MTEAKLEQYVRELEITHRAWSETIKHEMTKLATSMCFAGAPNLPQKPAMFLNEIGDKTLAFCYWSLTPMYSIGVVRSDFGYSFGMFPSWQYGGISEPSENLLAANAIQWSHGIAKTPDEKYVWKMRDQRLLLHRQTTLDNALIRRFMAELSRKEYRKFRFSKGQWQRYFDPSGGNQASWNNLLVT